MDLQLVKDKKLPVVMKVIGAGGGGGNAVNRMIDCNIKGVEFIALNTDAQALNVRSKAPVKIYIGQDGQGAGADPVRGEEAAINDKEKIVEAIKGSHLLFITAGMGGGTGTGAAPIIAGFAKEMGILTVAVVTKPFEYEGGDRMKIAEAGIEKLKENVDSYIVIDNQRIMGMDDDDGDILSDFEVVDDILRQAIQGIIDVIYHTGNINVDFADIKTCLKEKGRVHMAIGKGEGDNAVIDAMTQALSNELLENPGIDGAKNVLVNIQGARRNLKRGKINEGMSSLIKANVDSCAKIFWGLDANEEYGDEVSVTIMATGFNDDEIEEIREKKENLTLNKIENEKSNIQVKPSVMPEDIAINGEFIPGSEWNKLNKIKPPTLPGLNNRNKTFDESEIKDGEFDFRASLPLSESELETPPFLRTKRSK